MIYIIYILLYLFEPIYWLILGTFRIKSGLYSKLLNMTIYLYKEDQIEYIIPLGPWCRNSVMNQQNFQSFRWNHIPFMYKIERLSHKLFNWYCGRYYRYRQINGKIIWDSDV